LQGITNSVVWKIGAYFAKLWFGALFKAAFQEVGDGEESNMLIDAAALGP